MKPYAAQMPPCLFHYRHHELRTLLHARGPAGGDGLGFGIEANAIRAVLVEVAER